MSFLDSAQTTSPDGGARGALRALQGDATVTGNVVASIVLALLVAGPSAARAQTVITPSFAVRASAESTAADPFVTASGDGTALFAWRESTPGDPTLFTILTQRYSADGLPLAAPVQVVVDDDRLTGLEISATFTGGYALFFRRFTMPQFFILAADGLRLSGSGEPMGLPFRVDDDERLSGFASVAGLPSGTVYQWGAGGSVRGRVYDHAGVPLGPSFLIGAPMLGSESDLAALADGGFVSVWSEQSATAYLPRLRVFNADGQPRTGIVVAGSTFYMKQVAADPSGGFGVIGASVRTIWAARFAPNGSLRSGPFVVADVPAPWRPVPEIEFDSQGNLFAVWAMFHEISGERGPLHARGFDRNDDAIGPVVTLDPGPANFPVHTARLTNDRFITTWSVNPGQVWADVVSLCTPGVSTCGDGVAHPVCEQCDDGAANSDTGADACRTNCRRASCGDGVIDTGEECDDGNRLNHDGCDQRCLVEVCGNGRRESGEICDDGDVEDGDGCDANCTPTGCGNSISTAGEECDDGNNANHDGCDQACLIEFCGNGRREAGEACDDGNASEGDGCDTNCTLSVCGNGVLAIDEECDDGNRANGDGCDVQCRIELCGNGRVEGDEACDDGNLVGDDACQADCNPTPRVDASLAALKRLRVTIPSSGDSSAKRVRLRVSHAGIGGLQHVRLTASDGSCPPGTVTAAPDFDRLTAGAQDVTALAPGQKATATLDLAFERAAFAVLDRAAPVRCTVTVAASSEAGTFDQNGSNNTIAIGVDVTDAVAPSNDPLEVILEPLRPQSIVIPPGLVGVDRRLRVRLHGTAAAGATLSANDGDCPLGTLTVTEQPGASGLGEILVRASRAFVTTTNPKSPARCTAALSAARVGDTETSNNSAPVTIDMMDRNDL